MTLVQALVTLLCARGDATCAATVERNFAVVRIAADTTRTDVVRVAAVCADASGLGTHHLERGLCGARSRHRYIPDDMVSAEVAALAILNRRGRIRPASARVMWKRLRNTMDEELPVK